MTETYSPPFTTETNEMPPWTDCTWAAGLMLANLATLGKFPNTRKERELLRSASGDHFGGSNLEDLSRGLLLRYGWGLPSIRTSQATLLLRLSRGYGAVVQGDYALLTTHFQRWDPAFAAKRLPLHAAFIQGHDRGGNYHLNSAGIPNEVFWNDPLGRSPRGTPADEQYRGEWMPVPILWRFMSRLGTQGARFAATMAQGVHAA